MEAPSKLRISRFQIFYFTDVIFGPVIFVLSVVKYEMIAPSASIYALFLHRYFALSFRLIRTVMGVL